MTFKTLNPATGQAIAEIATTPPEAIDHAVKTARQAFPAWSRRGVQERIKLLEAYAARVEAQAEPFARLIAEEAGKPLWEARTEVKAVIGKVAISIKAYAERTGGFGAGTAKTRFRPHGVVGVFGPFNFPAHLPNGHLVPALIAGNTAIFKPSEQTPLVGERLIQLMHEAGIPESVVQVMQGGAETGKALSEHTQLDGIFFTGSARIGELLHRQLAGQPHKILALEMGGNNPLIAWDCPPAVAAPLIAQSAFITAGQRCTCARRLIIADDDSGRAVLNEVVRWGKGLRQGDPLAETPPFIGPVISAEAANAIMASYQTLVDAGAQTLLAPVRGATETGFVRPGIVDVTGIYGLADEEIFGPLLQVIRVQTFDQAIETANATRFGLAAGLLTPHAQLWETFYERARAGIVNWNVPLPGASSAAPFGGIGASGNHRPSAYLAADYCVYPVASMQNAELTLPDNLPPGLELSDE